MVYTDKFDESEIPFEALAKFGITQEMIDDLRPLQNLHL